MIKTMLLTAQLALSPIVGTNGLQPKRLANPVYGETTDYSVTYNGVEYTRVLSGDYYAENVIHGSSNELYWGYKEQSKQEVCSDYLEWAEISNIRKEEARYYIEWDFNNDGFYDHSETYLTEYSCLSYWQINPNTATYTEIFFGEEQQQPSINIWLFIVNEGRLTWDDFYTQAVPDSIELGDSIYTHDPYESVDWGNHPRNIQNHQPTIANPSVYDNIYNFYYENLFANDALDDLNAEVGSNSLTMRQWLAHTATIISISLLACALIILVIKIFKLIAGSISDIWG